MQKSTNKLFFFKKQISVGGACAPKIASSDRVETVYSIKRNGLQITKPGNESTSHELAARSTEFELFKNMPGLEDHAHETQDGYLLIFPELDEKGDALLIRYLCDELDPVASFPAMTLREFHQFARIESYIGGDHSQFWQNYGFKDADVAVGSLNDACGQLSEGVDPAGNAPPSLVRILTNGIAQDLERKRKEELLEIRFSIDSELIPFVYGALRAHLTDISAERQRITAQTGLRDDKKTTHLQWLYQAMKEGLTYETVVTERTAILGSKLAAFAKSTAIGRLYDAGGGLLTAARLGDERAAILASDLRDCAQSIVINGLYGVGGALLTAGLIGTERAAILASQLPFMEQEDVLKALYHTGSVHLTAGVIGTERAAIGESGLNGKYKSLCIGSLYQASTVDLTAAEIGAERDAVWELVRVSAADKASSVSWLYHTRARSLTTPLIETELAAVWASPMSANNKSQQIVALYGIGGALFTANTIGTERTAILASEMSHEDKVATVSNLYGAGVACLTANTIGTERAAILVSALPDRVKGVMLSWLYGTGRAGLGSQTMEIERAAIRASGLSHEEKAATLSRLERAGGDWR